MISVTKYEGTVFFFFFFFCVFFVSFSFSWLCPRVLDRIRGLETIVHNALRFLGTWSEIRIFVNRTCGWFWSRKRSLMAFSSHTKLFYIFVFIFHWFFVGFESMTCSFVGWKLCWCGCWCCWKLCGWKVEWCSRFFKRDCTVFSFHIKVRTSVCISYMCHLYMYTFCTFAFGVSCYRCFFIKMIPIEFNR